MNDPVGDTTVFTKNQERLPQGKVARAFFERMLTQAKARHFLPAEHFTVDGTTVPSPIRFQECDVER